MREHTNNDEYDLLGVTNIQDDSSGGNFGVTILQMVWYLT